MLQTGTEDCVMFSH